MWKNERDIAVLKTNFDYTTKMIEKIQTTLDKHIESEYKDKEELKEFVATKIEGITKDFVSVKAFEEHKKSINHHLSKQIEHKPLNINEFFTEKWFAYFLWAVIIFLTMWIWGNIAAQWLMCNFQLFQTCIK